MYRVVFPFELKLPNTTDDAAGRDALYSLFAVVVHVGSGPHHGEAVAANDCWHTLHAEHEHQLCASGPCCSCLPIAVAQSLYLASQCLL
jgi:hypothetical protein